MSVAAGLYGASMLIGAISQYQAGQSESNAAGYNAQVAEANSVLARQQAAEDERVYRIAARKEIGQARASYAASGVAMEGSALDVLSDMASTAELDALKVRHAGEVKSRGFAMDAELSRRRASAAEAGGGMGAIATLIGGGARIASLKRTV